MIVFPKNDQQWRLLAAGLQVMAQVKPTAELRLIAWLDTEATKLRVIVGFNGFVGRTAQIHVGMEKGYHFVPRQLIHATFDYAFNTCALGMLLGVLNSRNERALRFNAHLGFRELHRLPGMHDDGGDMVLMGMKREECRYVDAASAPALMGSLQ